MHHITDAVGNAHHAGHPKDQIGKVGRTHTPGFGAGGGLRNPVPSGIAAMRMEHWEANPSLIIPVPDWVVPAFAFSTSRKHSVTIRERSTQYVYLAVNWFAGPLLPQSLVRNTQNPCFWHLVPQHPYVSPVSRGLGVFKLVAKPQAASTPRMVRISQK